MMVTEMGGVIFWQNVFLGETKATLIQTLETKPTFQILYNYINKYQ